MVYSPLVKSVYSKNNFIFFNQNICWYTKEPSHWDGSFEHPKQMLKLMNKEMFMILNSKCLPIWTYGIDCLWYLSSYQECIKFDQ